MHFILAFMVALVRVAAQQNPAKVTAVTQISNTIAGTTIFSRGNATTIAPAASTTSTMATAAISSSTCVSALPTSFYLQDKLNHDYYAVNISGNGQLYAVNTTTEASPLWVNKTCDGSICDIKQLSYNVTCPITNTTTRYGAFVPEEGGPTFFSNKIQGAFVTAAWSSFLCELVLIPFLDHDVSNVYLCDGVINLSGAGSQEVCQATTLTVVPA
ncbi:hypothetical protein EJ03DRAFT_86861 [Teratosphaeria nubilosa]|uniref:Uncharacterized protein n=1 Tax=Teratosphaeria nubilosa TaxID=161662 RepID=A0A6G1LA20_9PEZI|nr:hypothetical protein EJ03DRAFT_86861 [Teratosphaeria nubilosa]